ncbi:MAG TPA: peroxiredoxin [Vicinamibacterales bacterium]
MSIKVGDRIPDLTLTRATAGGPTPITTREVFDGRKVVLFAVPGAFTPTCHKQHLPGYLAQYDAIKAKGIDTIACVAMNDPFVMQAWADASGVGERILMLADGNGEFTKAVGLEVDLSKFGMGVRSQRYAMVVENGVVKELNVEQPGKLEVSAADAVVCQL